MGFGILFLGYLLTFGSAFFTRYLFLDIVGCAVMIAGLVLLCRFNRSFKAPVAASVLLLFAYASAAAMRSMGYGGVTDAESTLIGPRIYEVIGSYVIPTVALCFYAALLYAIARLAREVELPHIVRRCRNYTVTFMVYFGMWVLFDIFGDRLAAASVRVYNVTAAGLNLFIAAWLIMMVLLIMSCMKWIAPADELEAEARGEDVHNDVLSRLGDKLNEIESVVKTPREEKEAKRLKHELDEAERLREDDKSDKA